MKSGRTGSRVLLAVLSGSVLLLSGCVVRTYPLTRDRVDQDLTSSSGNRGYLTGSGPVGGVEKERSTTRTTQVVEIEMHSPLKFDNRRPKAEKEVIETEEESYTATTTSTGASSYSTDWGMAQETQSSYVAPAVSYTQYTVQKGDTLQKISNKFYGTTRKWMKIYEANKTTLKSPDRVRPGQVLDIPDASSSMQEPAENLK